MLQPSGGFPFPFIVLSGFHILRYATQLSAAIVAEGCRCFNQHPGISLTEFSVLRNQFCGKCSSHQHLLSLGVCSEQDRLHALRSNFVTDHELGSWSDYSSVLERKGNSSTKMNLFTVSYKTVAILPIEMLKFIER